MPETRAVSAVRPWSTSAVASAVMVGAGILLTNFSLLIAGIALAHAAGIECRRLGLGGLRVTHVTLLGGYLAVLAAALFAVLAAASPDEVTPFIFTDD